MIDNTEFVTKPPAIQALQKIVTFAQDIKSTEIRYAAKMCIVAMWNCNTPQVTMMLTELPKEQQNIVSTIIHSHMRKNSSNNEVGNLSGSGGSKLLSPDSTTRRDIVNQEEIYRNLRKTTAEIQNYSYETLGKFHRA